MIDHTNCSVREIKLSAEAARGFEDAAMSNWSAFSVASFKLISDHSIAIKGSLGILLAYGRDPLINAEKPLL